MIGSQAAFQGQQAQGTAIGICKKLAAIYAFLAGFEGFEDGGAADRRYSFGGCSCGAAIALDSGGGLGGNCGRGIFGRCFGGSGRLCDWLRRLGCGDGGWCWLW